MYRYKTFKFLHISKCEYVMHSSNRICECDQIQTIEYINIRIYEYVNMIKFKYANMYIYEYMNVIKFKQSNTCMCRLTPPVEIWNPLQWKLGVDSTDRIMPPYSGN